MTEVWSEDSKKKESW